MNIAEALRNAAGRLDAVGIERPQAEARLLLEAAAGASRADIVGFPERVLSPEQIATLEQLLSRRCAREPISRILGRREFWSLTFRVSSATLDPRPDSETLVSAVLQRIADRAQPLQLLDLGTGTGCLLLALLSELPNAQGLGVHRDPEAVAVAAANAEALGLGERAAFALADWGRGIWTDFDIIVSNSPYIESAAIAGLQPEVALHDPPAALDGGADGLDAYRALIPDAARLLWPGGLLALEIGMGQSESVGRIATGAGFSALGTAADLAGIPRCLLFSRV